MSGEGLVVASKIDELHGEHHDNTVTVTEKQPTAFEVDEKTAHKVKLLNTTKRIRQFSHGLKEP